MDNPKDSKVDCAADVESDIEQHNSMEDLEYPGRWDVNTAPDVPGLIRPTPKSQCQAETVLVTVNAIDTRWNMEDQKKYDKMHQCFTSFCVYLDRET